MYLPRIVDLPEKHHGVLFKSHKKELNMLQVTSPEDILSLVPHGPYKLREPPLESPDGKHNVFSFPNLTFNSSFITRS